MSIASESPSDSWSKGVFAAEKQLVSDDRFMRAVDSMLATLKRPRQLEHALETKVLNHRDDFGRTQKMVEFSESGRMSQKYLAELVA